MNRIAPEGTAPNGLELIAVERIASNGKVLAEVNGAGEQRKEMK